MFGESRLLLNKISYKSMFEGIIFDLEGLLVDSQGWQLQAWNEYLKKFKIELTEDDWERLKGRRAYEVAELVRRQFDLENDPLTMTEERQETLINLVDAMDQIEELPGAGYALEMLKDNGLRLALATSDYKDYVWLVLEKLGLDECFDVLVSGDIVPETRPNPMPLLACAETFALHPANCLAIAKDRPGVEAALNAEMKVICVPAPQVPRWRISGADLVLPSLSSLNMPLLRSIWFEAEEGPQPQPHLYRVR